MDKEKRDELIMSYAPLVKTVVERVAMKLPSHVDREDLINVGVIGLMSALDRYDETRNVRFEIYARFRIRGAILDELRSRDVVSRSTRNKDSILEKAISALRNNLGRHPTEEDIAGYLNISLDEYYKMLDEARGVSILSQDDLPPNFCERYGSDEVMESVEKNNPLSFITKKEQKELLREAIDSLPEKEKTILALYYYEELTLKEIGEVVSLTESRICQIHSQAILRLRGRLREWENNGFFT